MQTFNQITWTNENTCDDSFVSQSIPTAYQPPSPPRQPPELAQTACSRGWDFTS